MQSTTTLIEQRTAELVSKPGEASLLGCVRCLENPLLRIALARDRRGDFSHQQLCPDLGKVCPDGLELYSYKGHGVALEVYQYEPKEI